MNCCKAVSESCGSRSNFGLLVAPDGSKCWYHIFFLIMNIALTPIILVGKYFVAYVFPFITSTIAYSFFCCCNFCLTSKKYCDDDFKPNDDSLGHIKTSKKDIEWIRLPDLNAGAADKNRMQLFSTHVEHDNKTRGFCEMIMHECLVKSRQLVYKRIEAEDISQGALGDCWLLSSLAALSEQPHYIRNIFLTPQFNPRGKYRLRIYDPKTKQFITIVVDDFIPCNKTSKKPIFTSPVGKEAWVMLVEKMFAKYQRSYANIEGNTMLYALITLTGCNGNHFERTDKGWQIFDLVVKPPKSPKERDEVYLSSSSSERRNDHDAFDLVMKLLNKKCILAAGTKGEDKTIEQGRGKEGGIVPGHAYSILRACRPKLTQDTLRLVKLRNPWGSFEWNGDWSDKSEQWKMYPGVKTELWPNLSDNDGCFWMTWEDFVKYYSSIDVIYAGGDGLDSINIDIKEEFGVLGPCCGFTFGTLKYWACCLGPYKLWCSPQERRGRTLNDIETGTLDKLVSIATGSKPHHQHR